MGDPSTQEGIRTLKAAWPEDFESSVYTVPPPEQVVAL